MQEKVAHFHRSFFEKTETFIYLYISHLRQYRPVCMASEYNNLDMFPFPAEDMYAISAGRYSPKWLYRWSFRALTGREVFLEKNVRRAGCSLLHAHYGPSGCVAAGSLDRLGIPLVTTFYGHDLSMDSFIESYRDRYGLLFRRGDMFLVEGPYMRERLIELGCPAEKVEIQRIAISTGDIPFRPRTPKGEGERAVILFAGRLIEKKGLQHLIPAAAEAGRRRGGFELRIVGDGPLRDEAKMLAGRSGLGERIVFTGLLSYREHLEELGRADIYIQPSVTAVNGDSEGGAPTTLLEAQASGLPVITTDHADIPNIVVPGESAVICPQGDEEALRDAIVDLLERQESWEGMGRAGRGFVEASHDIEKEARHLEERYSRLIGGPR